jgi:hypothetical protein
LLTSYPVDVCWTLRMAAKDWLSLMIKGLYIMKYV